MDRSAHLRPGVALRSAVAVVGITLLLSAQGSVALALGGTTFQVTNGADSGAGSLREAIQGANSNPGADTISFANPVDIAPTSALPAIEDPLTIDGMLGAIRLLGSSEPTDRVVNGLQVDAGGSGSVIRDLAISGFTGSGIYLNGAHDTVVGGETANLGNVITRNGNDGVTIVGDATAINNRILGNRIYDNAGGGSIWAIRSSPAEGRPLAARSAACPPGRTATSVRPQSSSVRHPCRR